MTARCHGLWRAPRSPSMSSWGSYAVCVRLRRHTITLYDTHQADTADTATQHDTCTQNVIEDHTDDAHVTTTVSSKTKHVSFSCKRAASTGTDSRAWDHHGSRLDIDTRQHPCTTSGSRAKQKQCKTWQLLVSAPTRPTTLSSCHPLARPSVVTRPYATTPGRRSPTGRNLPTTQRAAVRRNTASKAGARASYQADVVRP